MKNLDFPSVFYNSTSYSVVKHASQKRQLRLAITLKVAAILPLTQA